jgi:hypothetical protein
MEWFSALDIAKPKKSSKDQHKCLPISKIKKNELKNIQNICNKLTL